MFLIKIIKNIVFILIAILCLNYNEAYAANNKTLIINDRTTPTGIYEQIGSHGINVSDDLDEMLTLYYDVPMEVHYFNWSPFTVCKYGCDAKGIYLTFEIDKKNQSFLRNTFKGIFNQKFILSPLYEIQIEK